MTTFIHTLPEWIELITLNFLIGLLGCRLWAFDRFASSASREQEPIRIGIRRMLGVCVALMIFSSSVNLILRAAEMSGHPLSTVNLVLGTVIFHTHLGHAWLVRIGALFLLFLSLVVTGGSRDSRAFAVIMLAIALVILMTESASGHASDKGDFSIPEIIDFLHFLAASAWGGGLLALSLVMLPLLSRPDAQTAELIADLAGGFSRIAGIAVGIIAITALYNTWLYVGSFEALWRSPYGWTVFAKGVLFSLLLPLGAFNRYVSVPLLLEEGADYSTGRGMIPRIAGRFISRHFSGHDRYAITLRFKRLVRVEALIIIGALLCAALLRHEVPALHHSHAEHERMQHTAGGPAPIVSLVTAPAPITAGIPVTLNVRMKDPEGRPLQGIGLSHERILHMLIIGRDMTSFAHIHTEDAGPITNEMLKKADFPLHYTFPKSGEYLIGTDFLAGDVFYSRMFHLTVSGKHVMDRPKMDFSTNKIFGEYRVTLSSSPVTIKAGEETSLRYSVEKDSEAVTDLNPYLGAAMHIAIVSLDLKQYIHVHGSTPGEPHAHHDHMHSHPPRKFGPEIEADVVFPVKGVYTIFAQVKHRKKVLLFDFMVNVQ
jgi:putative copper resistance protein D